MRLRRLGLYGFKSFADKTEIEFGNGITGIVGPNGSGKSNISDAIRWVLGEQNIRIIRGTKIEDVIFKGSKTRRASGIAEVSLTFENQDDMAIDFKEVLVRRRIFRTGDSEFFINQTRCRLKDIVDLFSDTGIGLGGLSMINQNRVDDVLKAKPDERRVFFEETIGITKYRNRKRETLNKIEDAENNLIRISDIINELQTQLKPLEYQAERTNKYNSLSAERRNLQLIALNRKHQHLSSELNKNLQLQRSSGDECIAMQTELANEDVNKERLNKVVIDIENKLHEQAEQNEIIRKSLDFNEHKIVQLSERQTQGKSIHVQIKNQQKQLSSTIEVTESELLKLQGQLNQQRNQLQDKQAELNTTQTQSNELETQLKLQTDKHHQLEQTILDLQKKLSKMQNDALIIEHDLQTLEGNQQSYKSDELKLVSESAALQQELNTLQSNQKLIDEEISNTDKTQQDLNRLLKYETKISADLQLEEERHHKQKHIIESRLQILKRMQQNYEGFAKAPKAVLMSKAAWRTKVYGAVGELLNVPEKFATAIEIALGGSVQNIVTEDEETAKFAIEFLKREKLGRVTFLPLSRIAGSSQINKINEPGVIGFANEVVETKSKLSKIADFLLSKTLIVDNIDNALRIANRHHIRIVTLEGEVLNIGGSISGGSSRPVETNIFNRYAEIDSLTDKLTDLNKKIDNIQNQRDISTNELKSINKKIDSLNKTNNELKVKLAENRISITQTKKLFDDRQNQLKNLQNSLTQQTNSIDELQNRRRNYNDTIKSITEDTETFNKQFDKSSDTVKQTELQFKSISKHLKQLEIDCAVSEQKTIRMETQFEQLQNKLNEDKSKLKNLQAEERQLLKNMSDTVIELAKLNKDNEITQTRLAYGQEQTKQMYSAKMDKLSQIAAVDKNIRELNRKLSETKNQLHELDLNITQLKIQIADCEDKIRALSSDVKLNSETQLDNPNFIDLDDDTIAERINKITAELEDIGAVNPNAPQEFNELNTRCDFLNTQFEDLKTAKNNLHSLIKDIDEKIVTQFLEAFSKIQIFFSEIFVQLFGGGSAQLELTNKEDVLHSGVEIMATLPQKKRQPLSVLSGGERALTVIALLFSFLKYRPSPFCILDEVDAPLDEANLVRFGQFVNTFSQNTQFIVITHRKTTMEFLDRIYGVTIEDAGVSKILSVEINKP